MKRVKYLGVHITHNLDWTHHVLIMANHACSNIHRINLLGNLICGLEFYNWHKVFNTLVIPILTYGALVWYTSINQKGLVQCLQVAQNEGVWKITGAFHTMLIEPLHNLTVIPPISYMLPKLIHSFQQ